MRELKLGNDFMSMLINNFIQQRSYFSILKALFHVSRSFFLVFWGGGERVVRGGIDRHACQECGLYEPFRKKIL